MLFLILIAVGLFAALTFAIAEGENLLEGHTEANPQQIQQARLDTYTANITTALTRLERQDCSNDRIDYTPPPSSSPWPAKGDFSCYLFHPKGGGAYYDEQLGAGGCSDDELKALNAGQSCGTLVYVGLSQERRLYTTLADMGRHKWSTDNTLATKAASDSDGFENTDTVLSAKGQAAYPAFSVCRSLGPGWHLPAASELGLLYANRHLGALRGTFNNTISSRYWSSTEISASDAKMLQFSTGRADVYTPKDYPLGWFTRCVMRLG